jgi:transcriptional regulator GlxA family with amidase domain
MFRRSLVLVLLATFATVASACRAPFSADEPPRPTRELAVGFLIVDGVYNTELTAPYDVFHHTVFHAEPGMRVFTVAPTREPVRTFEGLHIVPDFDLESAPPIDVLVVPSAQHNMDSDLENAALIEWVRTSGQRSQFVLSLCDGAFVLAQAGLLEGRACTTFPSDVERMREMFPQLSIHEDVSFVHDGAMITSAGGAKSFEAALYLCELLYGRKAAVGIGRGLCIDWDLDAVECLTVP